MSPHPQRTPGAGMGRVLGGVLASVILTAAALWIAFGTPLQHQVTALTQQNTALTRAHTELQRQIDASKEEGQTFKESQNALAAQNTLLSQTNRQSENKQRDLLVQLLRTRVYVVVEQLKGTMVIPVGVRNPATMAIHRIFTVNHTMENGFTKKSWRAVIARVQEQLRAYDQQSKGVKYAITVKDQLNLKVAIDLALADRRNLGETEQAFIQALREKMHEYIQQNPEGFSIPLHFVFTGVDMTVSEANKERQRVAGLYQAVARGEQHFDSSIQATVEPLFWHIWPALEHVPPWRLYGYDEWYGRAAQTQW